MSWTKVAKPGAQVYTGLTKPGAQSYTNVPKPQGSVIATLPAGRASGLLIPLTFPNVHNVYNDGWVKINKPT